VPEDFECDDDPGGTAYIHNVHDLLFEIEECRKGMTTKCKEYYEIEMTSLLHLVNSIYDAIAFYQTGLGT
jgi:hypothetical protein